MWSKQGVCVCVCVGARKPFCDQVVGISTPECGVYPNVMGNRIIVANLLYFGISSSVCVLHCVSVPDSKLSHPVPSHPNRFVLYCTVSHTQIHVSAYTFLLAAAAAAAPLIPAQLYAKSGNAGRIGQGTGKVVGDLCNAIHGGATEKELVVDHPDRPSVS